MVGSVRSVLVVCLVLLATACTDRSYTPVMPSALKVGKEYTVFAGTTRAPESNGHFGYKRSEKLRHLELKVSIPPTHTPGNLIFGYRDPNPHRQFVLAGQEEFETPDGFEARLRNTLLALPKDERDVTVFVHGYNATQSETAFRAAQLGNDIKIPGPLVIYSWPSRGKALGYAYDNDSVLFARDGLERLLRQISRTGANRVVLVAHSIGSALTMETLRQIDIKSPGWPAKALGGVVLISPDLDVEVFRSQMTRISKVPQPFVVFVSQKDKVLNLSARLRGTVQQDRLGTIDNSERVADLPIEIFDTTAFSENAGSGHFIPATSPALIALLLRAGSVSSTFGEENINLTNLLTGRPSPGKATKTELVPRVRIKR